jgi:hypothetical protein
MKNLKKHLLIFLLVVPVFSACEFFEDLGVDFDTGYFYVDFIINEDEETGEKTFVVEVLKSEIDSILDAHDLSRDNLKEVHPKELIIEINNDGPGYNFDPISSFSADISAEGLDQVLVAKINPVPDNVKSVSLNVEDKELKDYLLKEFYTITIKGVTSDPVESRMDVTAKLKFTMKGGL